MLPDLLVTGSTGVIGDALMKRLENDYNLHGISFSQGFDIRDATSLKKFDQNIDIVIHSAACFGDDSPVSMADSLTTNILGTLNVLNLAVASSCKTFLYISTVSAYEHDDNEYFSAYGLSKRQGEEWVSYICKQSGIRPVILRASQVYDTERSCEKHQKALYRLIDTVSANERVVLHGNKNPLRNFLHLDDLVEVIAKTLTRDVHGVKLCAHPVSINLLELISIIGEVTNITPQVIWDRTKADIPSIHIPDDNSLYQQLGFFPAISMREGIEMIAKQPDKSDLERQSEL